MSLAPNTNNIIKTVLITPGEKFTLPPGAVTISSTGVLSSTCNNIPEVSDVECYVFMSVQQNDSGSHTEPWQEDNIKYLGIRLNGTEYLFDNEVTWIGQGEDLPNEIKRLPVGGLFMGFNYNSNTDSQYGTKAYFVFKAPVGVIKSLELITFTGTLFAGGSGLTYYVPAIKRSEFLTKGHANVPDCT